MSIDEAEQRMVEQNEQARVDERGADRVLVGLASGRRLTNLERGGRHWATIFRKVSRFRAAYEAHPDESVFPWIELDLNTAWSDPMFRRIEQARTGVQLNTFMSESPSGSAVCGGGPE